MCRPKPLYHSTASQLGLHKTRGIPNLLDFVLPRTAPQVDYACPLDDVPQTPGRTLEVVSAAHAAKTKRQ